MLRYAWNKNNSLLLCAGTFFFANVIIISGDISISFDHPTPGEKMLLSCKKKHFLGEISWRILQEFKLCAETWPSDQNCIFSLFTNEPANVFKGKGKNIWKEEYCKIFLGLQGPFRIIEYNRFPPVHAKKLTSLKGKTKIEEKILA